MKKILKPAIICALVCFSMLFTSYTHAGNYDKFVVKFTDAEGSGISDVEATFSVEGKEPVNVTTDKNGYVLIYDCTFTEEENAAGLIGFEVKGYKTNRSQVGGVFQQIFILAPNN
ncbi:hypothetical protein HON59_01680 [bacterium]|nr:hypothetical protein [bacterium]MBT3730209.1 hypothetical protein [bacterium]MBT4894754.1 hypothetical protein [bacterium]